MIKDCYETEPIITDITQWLHMYKTTVHKFQRIN